MRMQVKKVSDAVMPTLLPLIALDRRLAREALASDVAAPPPIFVVGPPRTGTTILVQRLLNRYRFTYTCNADSALFTLPVLANRITARFKVGRGDRDQGETSEYGYVSGPWSVSEAGSMMRYFLDNEDDERRLTHFRGAVLDASRRSGRPYLTKNTVNALRLRVVLRAFPDAFVIRTDRERESTARSILKMRRLRGGEHVWAGPAPQGSEQMSDREPIDQARWQIQAIHDRLDADLSEAGREAFPVRMEEFLERSDHVLGDIAHAYQEASGFALARTDLADRARPDKSS